MMLRWLSRSKGFQAQITRNRQSYSSSASPNDGLPEKPSNPKKSPFEDDRLAETKAILDANKKETEDKRKVFLEEEKQPSTYDVLKKKYIEQNMNRYDSQVAGKDFLEENPIQRAYRVFMEGFTYRNFVRFMMPERIGSYGTSDFLIVGSGISASLLAFFLKSEVPQLEITVLEEDSLIGCEPLAINGESLIMQWNMPHYIRMANFAFKFYHSLPEMINIKEATLKFFPLGSLLLSSSSEDVDGRCTVYNDIDWQYERMNGNYLRSAFPWLNIDGIQEGVHGLRGEGWVDPWSVLAYSRILAMSVGVHYMKGEIASIIFNQHPDVDTEDRNLGEVDAPRIAVVRQGKNELETVDFSNIVLAAGLRNRFNSIKLHIGDGPGYLRVPLPLKVRKRYMFRLRCNDAPVINFPLIMDPSGFRIRREGYSGRYLCWREPLQDEEPESNSLDVDMDYFEEKIRGPLIKRIPVFKNAEVEDCWSGFVDINEFDGEPIIGFHPSYGNVFFVTGLGSNELIFSPAIAKASAEILLESEYKTIDCSAFLMDRILFNDPIIKQTPLRF